MKRDMREMLLWLSTADREILEQCPGEETRFVAAGGAVLTTTAIATLAGWFAARALLHMGALGSLLFGLGWGLAIMNLERYLQSSIRRQSTSVRTLMMASPRLALAYLLGLVISTPLLIAVFHPEVTAQVEVDKNEEVASARSALKRQYGAVPTLQARVQTLEREVTTPFAVGTVLSTSPEYHGLAGRYGKYKTAAEGAPNAHAAAADEHVASVLLGQMLPLRQELLAQEAEDNANRKANERRALQTARAQLQPLRTLLEGKESAVERRFHAPSGYADQVRALGRLVAHNAAVGSERTDLWLFILAMDSLPALLKALMCMGRRSLYERTQDEVEDRALEAARVADRATVKEAERVAAEQREIQTEVGRARVARFITDQKAADGVVADIQQEVVRPHIERWARRTAAQYVESLEEKAAPQPDVHPEEQERHSRAGRTPLRRVRSLVDRLGVHGSSREVWR